LASTAVFPVSVDAFGSADGSLGIAAAVVDFEEIEVVRERDEGGRFDVTELTERLEEADVPGATVVLEPLTNRPFGPRVSTSHLHLHQPWQQEANT
jgi:hypothetical protein